MSSFTQLTHVESVRTSHAKYGRAEVCPWAVGVRWSGGRIQDGEGCVLEPRYILRKEGWKNILNLFF